MQVKGTAVKTTRDFVRTRYPDRYDQWLSLLTPDSQSLFHSTLDATAWYPYKTAYAEPVRRIMEMFFGNNLQLGGDQLGAYSAEIALKGFYKVFLLIASPQFLLQRASKIFTTFYDPSVVEAEMAAPNVGVLRIKKFDEIDESVEFRIAGWIKKALEMANCNETSYAIKKSMARGEDFTEIHFTWL